MFIALLVGFMIPFKYKERPGYNPKANNSMPMNKKLLILDFKSSKLNSKFLIEEIELINIVDGIALISNTIAEL